MKNSNRGFITFAIACVMAAGSWAIAAVDKAVSAAYSVCRSIKASVMDGFIALAQPTPGVPVAVPFIRARAFVLRIIKRDRPVVTSTWRMCPST
ncbi:MAG: hypothetical protein V4706_01590 [Pseudomonadota bacterium]